MRKLCLATPVEESCALLSACAANAMSDVGEAGWAVPVGEADVAEPDKEEEEEAEDVEKGATLRISCRRPPPAALPGRADRSVMCTGEARAFFHWGLLAEYLSPFVE